MCNGTICNGTVDVKRCNGTAFFGSVCNGSMRNRICSMFTGTVCNVTVCNDKVRNAAVCNGT